MKTTFALCCFILLAPAAVTAAALSRSTVWIEVKETANDSRKKNTYPTTWGSYHYVFDGYKELEVKLHNSAAAPATVGVQAVFIGRSPGGGFVAVSNQQQVIDLGRADFVWSVRADFAGNDLNLVLAQVRTVSGTRPHGWVVQVWQGGKVIARKASLAELEKWLDENPVDPKSSAPAEKKK